MTPEEHDILVADHTAIFVGTDGLPTIPGQRGQGATSAIVDYLAYLSKQVAEVSAKLDALQPVAGVAPHTHEGGTSGPVAQ